MGCAWCPPERRHYRPRQDFRVCVVFNDGDSNDEPVGRPNYSIFVVPYHSPSTTPVWHGDGDDFRQELNMAYQRAYEQQQPAAEVAVRHVAQGILGRIIALWRHVLRALGLGRLSPVMVQNTSADFAFIPSGHPCAGQPLIVPSNDDSSSGPSGPIPIGPTYQQAQQRVPSPGPSTSPRRAPPIRSTPSDDTLPTDDSSHYVLSTSPKSTPTAEYASYCSPSESSLVDTPPTESIPTAESSSSYTQLQFSPNDPYSTGPTTENLGSLSPDYSDRSNPQSPDTSSPPFSKESNPRGSKNK